AFALTAAPVTAAELATLSGLEEDAAARELEALAAHGAAVRLGGERALRYAAPSVLQKQRAAIENALLKFHAENPAATGIAKDALRRRCLPRADAGCFDALLDDAVARGAAVTDGGEVSHPKAGAGARKLEEQAAEQLRETLAAAAGAPPSTGELIASSGLDSSLVHRALGSLEKQGLVRRIGADFYFDVSALAAFEQAVRARLVDGPATAAELKDAMGTSRKYAIPLLEYFDSQAVTRREGDTRVPGGR
ncbi:helix-turn-helix domain-containing protein, partial [Eggerthella lenta]